MIEELTCWLDTHFSIGNIISLIAVMVSVLTVLISNANAKRLILNTKLEEMAELSIEFVGYYTEIFGLYKKLEELKRDWTEIRSEYYWELVTKSHSYHEWSGILKKMVRLGILNDAYMPDNLVFALVDERLTNTISLYNYILSGDEKRKPGFDFEPLEPEELAEENLSKMIIGLINRKPWYRRKWEGVW